MNPRTFSFPTVFQLDQALVSLTVRRVEYRTSGPTIAVLLEVPEYPQPDHRFILWSPVQSSHLGFGSLGSGFTRFCTRPYNLPFSSQIVTIDLALPVTSSTVLHRPTGEFFDISILPPSALDRRSDNRSEQH